MASSIAAGTTAGTALAFSGDTSGALVLQTNGTTTAVTISTNLLSGTTTILALTSTGIAVTGTLTSSGVLSATSPTFVTPILGTPTSGNLANCTGIPAPAALSTASGSAPSYSARAWVKFNGTGTPAINASGNVSSITDGGVGLYTINFTTAMADANYATIITAQETSAGARDGCIQLRGGGTYSTSAVQIFSGVVNAFNAVDNPIICVSVFR